MISDARGTYALVLSCAGTHRVRIGRLGFLHLQPGWYVYIGSAFGSGGLLARIRHHQRVAQRPHWHVDYLRRRARLDTIWYITGERREHEWAVRIGATPGAAIPVLGFGSSDCDCLAHLFWFEDRPSLQELAHLGAPHTRLMKSCSFGMLKRTPQRESGIIRPSGTR